MGDPVCKMTLFYRQKKKKKKKNSNFSHPLKSPKKVRNEDCSTHVLKPGSQGAHRIHTANVQKRDVPLPAVKPGSLCAHRIHTYNVQKRDVPLLVVSVCHRTAEAFTVRACSTLLTLPEVITENGNY